MTTIDPTIAAQSEKAVWHPWVKPKRSQDALRAVTRAWAEKIASAWAQRPVTVIYESVGVGASTTTEQDIDVIYLDDAVLLPKNARDLAAAIGIVIHELGHLRFTIKRGDIAAQWLVERNLYRTFNMVEDAKEEMQLLALRPGFEKYLKYAVVNHILRTAKPETMYKIYPLLAGREYLPEGLIDRCREFATDHLGDDVIDRFDELLAEFLETDPRVDPLRVVAIIEEIDGLFPTEGGCKIGEPRSGTSESGPSISGKGIRGRKEKNKGKKRKGKPEEAQTDERQPEETEEIEDEEDEAPEWNEDWHDEEEEAEDEEGEDGEGEGDDDDGEGEDEEDEDSEGEGEGEGEDEGDSPKGEGGSGIGDGPSVKHEAKPNQPSKPQTPEEHLLEQMKKMHQDLEEELASSLEEDFQLIESEAFGTGEIRRPSDLEVKFQRDMMAALHRMTERAKGGLDRRRPKGRLNIRRFIQNRERLDVEKTVYDKFRPNVANALDMEIVLAVDVSGSTGGCIDEMAGTLWALTTALESVGGPSVTVLTWDTDFTVKKVPSDKWRAKYVPTMTSQGGTNPLTALKFTRRVMSHSLKKQKLIFILTDGMWSHMDGCALAIQTLRQEGVDVYILGFGGFTVANLHVYRATDGSSGGASEVAQFIFKIAEERAERVLQAHGV